MNDGLSIAFLSMQEETFEHRKQTHVKHVKATLIGVIPFKSASEFKNIFNTELRVYQMCFL